MCQSLAGLYQCICDLILEDRNICPCIKNPKSWWESLHVWYSGHCPKEPVLLGLWWFSPRLHGFVRKEISIELQAHHSCHSDVTLTASTAFMAFSRCALVAARVVVTASDLGFVSSPLVFLFFSFSELHHCVYNVFAVSASSFVASTASLALVQSASIPICLYTWITVQTWNSNCLGVLDVHFVIWVHSWC